MSDLSTLLLLLLLAVVVAMWLKLSAARERAVQEARRQCEKHGLQLLDETVGLRGVRLRRANGLRVLERCYGFEVSVDGDDRQPGRLWMIGSSITSLSLPNVMRQTAEQTSVSTLTARLDNVVPLRPRPRASNDRLH